MTKELKNIIVLAYADDAKLHILKMSDESENMLKMAISIEGKDVTLSEKIYELNEINES